MPSKYASKYHTKSADKPKRNRAWFRHWAFREVTFLFLSLSLSFSSNLYGFLDFAHQSVYCRLGCFSLCHLLFVCSCLLFICRVTRRNKDFAYSSCVLSLFKNFLGYIYIVQSCLLVSLLTLLSSVVFNYPRGTPILFCLR
jgi:hypothetical protein